MKPWTPKKYQDILLDLFLFRLIYMYYSCPLILVPLFFFFQFLLIQRYLVVIFTGKTFFTCNLNLCPYYSSPNDFMPENLVFSIVIEQPFFKVSFEQPLFSPIFFNSLIYSKQMKSWLLRLFFLNFPREFTGSRYKKSRSYANSIRHSKIIPRHLIFLPSVCTQVEERKIFHLSYLLLLSFFLTKMFFFKPLLVIT